MVGNSVLTNCFEAIFTTHARTLRMRQQSSSELERHPLRLCGSP